MVIGQSVDLRYAAFGLDLESVPQVDHGMNAQFKESLPVLAVQLTERVRPVDAAPPDHLAIVGCVAAHIAKVMQAGEFNMSVHHRPPYVRQDWPCHAATAGPGQVTRC